MSDRRFGNANSRESYIKQFFKTSKNLRSGFATPEEAKIHHSNVWFQAYAVKKCTSTLGELLDPGFKKLSIVNSSEPRGNFKGSLVGYNGLWRISVYGSPKSKEYDIAVNVGGDYRFHSEVIKHAITSRHGESVYDQWRTLVKSDIQSLRVLVDSVRQHLKCVHWSYTCSSSSDRLCQQVGVSTHRGAAFLFPASYG